MGNVYPLALLGAAPVIPGSTFRVGTSGLGHVLDAGVGAEIVARFSGSDLGLMCRFTKSEEENGRGMLVLQSTCRARIIEIVQRPASNQISYHHATVEEIPFDYGRASAALRELFATLAAVSPNWAEAVGPLDDLVSLERCAHVASSLWMKEDQRTRIFEHPEETEAVVQSLLQGMVDHLSPKKKILAQLKPKHPKRLRAGTLTASVEAGTLVIGHPSDWAEVPAPGAPDAILRACLPGTMAAWNTGGDLAFSIRFTDKPVLSAPHRRLVTASARFLLVVSHGRVFAGDPFMVLGEPVEQVRALAEEDAWIDVPNGDYECLVHALKMEADAPNYLVQLIATEQTVPVLTDLPDLDAWKSVTVAPLTPLGAATKAKTTKTRLG